MELVNLEYTQCIIQVEFVVGIDRLSGWYSASLQSSVFTLALVKQSLTRPVTPSDCGVLPSTADENWKIWICNVTSTSYIDQKNVVDR